VTAPDAVRFAVDPALSEVLAGVVEVLGDHGVLVDADRLADEPAKELARATGLGTAAELDQLVQGSTDEEALARRTAARAAAWRAVIVRLGTLLAVEPGFRPSDIRVEEERVDRLVPRHPAGPPDLRDCLDAALASAPRLIDAVRDRLADPADDVPGVMEAILWAAGLGVDVSQAERVGAALDADTQATAARVETQIEQLRATGVCPARPADLVPAHGRSGGSDVEAVEPAQRSTTKKVAAIKVGERADKRKRELGDQGESWALSAVVAELLDLEPGARRDALASMRDLLVHFDGTPVQQVRSLLDELVTSTFTDDDLLLQLTSTLRVSEFSDGFGFDLLGFLSPGPGQEPCAMCLEVKSASGQEFHLSTGEWKTAELLASHHKGHAYAVLVVRRGPKGGAPSSMELLADPVGLADAEILRKEPDGYTVSYGSRPTATT